MDEGAAAPSYEIRSSDMCDRGTEACLRQWRIKAGGASGIARSDFATMRVPRKAASRFLYHFLAVCEAHKKMMFYPLQVCVSKLAASDRQQYFVDGLNPSANAGGSSLIYMIISQITHLTAPLA